MLARLSLIVLLFGLLGDTGSEKGREGNALFGQERYAAAASAYRAGLSALDDTTGALYAGLQNNLALALHRQGNDEAARAALDRARRAAATDAERVRSLFNTATVAAARGEAQEALRHYKRVLLLDPTHEAARFNYEYLKRRRGEDPSAAQSPDVDPSPYARRLKQKAEALVAEAQYTTAAAVMRDGLQRDSTVRAYRDFLRRIETVAQIDRSQP